MSEIPLSPPPTLLSFSFSCVGSVSLSGYDWWPLRLWQRLSPASLGFHSTFHPTRQNTCFLIAPAKCPGGGWFDWLLGLSHKLILEPFAVAGDAVL